MTKKYDKELKMQTIQMIHPRSSLQVPSREDCEAFDVSRSGYFKWTKRNASKREKRRRKLERRIRRIFLESRRLYGSHKVAKELHKQGVRVS